MDKAKDFLSAKVELGEGMVHTPYGEVHPKWERPVLSDADQMHIDSQESFRRVILGLQDNLGPEDETEEEANDFEWPQEDDPFRTEHTVQELIEEDFSGNPYQRAPEKAGQSVKEAESHGGENESEDPPEST